MFGFGTGPEVNGAGRGGHRESRDVEVTGLGIPLAVGEDQLELGRLLGRFRGFLHLSNAICEAHVFDLADRKGDLDRVELRDARELRLRAHQIADLRAGDRRHARDGRLDLRPLEIEPRLFDRGARRIHLRGTARARLDRVVQLLLADGAFGRERCIARDVQLVLGQRGARTRELARRLVEGRLELAGIDLEEQIAFLHDAAVAIGLLEQIALDLGKDLGVHEAVGGSDPLRVDLDVPLLGRRHHDFHQRPRHADVLPVAGQLQAGDEQEDEDHRQATRH